MDRKKHELFARFVAILILAIGIILGVKSSASVESAETICVTEIKKSEQLIENTMGNDGVVVQASNTAIAQCRADFNERQIEVFSRLAERCDLAFADVQGTTIDALKSYCQLNAIRFIMSLQLQRTR
jgi:hypothetical protein